MIRLLNSPFVKHWKISASFLVLALIYLAQAVFVRADPVVLAKYHITSFRLHELGLVIALPYIAIWLVALMGYLHLRAYVSTINDSKDGAAFRTISVGILILVIWLPLSSILSGFTNQIHITHPDMTADIVRLGNYANLMMLLAGFYYVYRGSRQLLQMIKRLPSYGGMQKISLSFIALSPFYTYLTLLDPARRRPTDITTIATYYQPDWLIILTFVVPRLLMWYLGLQAVYNLFLYRRYVRGSIYQIALQQLARGLAWVVVTTIVLRCLQSLSSVFSRMSLGLLLAVVFALLILIAVGYILIARGARSLRRIEEL